MLFVGRISNPPTTSFIIDEDSLNDDTTDLVSDTSQQMITFQCIGSRAKVGAKCQTPDGAGEIRKFIETTLTYQVQLTGDAELRNYFPHAVIFSKKDQVKKANKD